MSGWTEAPPDFAPPACVHRVADSVGASWLITVSPETGDITIEAAAGNTRDPDTLTMSEEDRLYAQIPTAAPCSDDGSDFGLDLMVDEDDRVQICGIIF